MTSLGVGGGIFSSFPPTPRLGRACTRASFCLRGRAVLVACNSLTSFVAWGPGLPPIHRLGHSRALPFANTILIIILISNLNVNSKFQTQIGTWASSESYKWNFKMLFFSQTLYYWNLYNGIFLIGITFAYTTSDVYLTLMSKLEIYSIYFHEITIYVVPMAFNKQIWFCDDQY